MQKSNYTALEKWLHKLALGSRTIAEMSFEIDQVLGDVDSESAANQKHVFIAGLARAGTTILLRNLHATGDYESLTYRDMPFVLAPNTWKHVAKLKSKRVEEAERAHGDSLLVGVDSPESLDEVFWRVFVAQEYIRSDCLAPHAPGPEVLSKYVAYVAAILDTAAAPKRYLCKNNNNLLRLGSISSIFPKALLLIPFRDPVQHASSLHRQHRRFLEMQRADDFVLSYMNWLGHHEFGLGHRPFRFPGVQSENYSTTTVNYWLQLWCEAYEWTASARPESAVFICYEELCKRPSAWTRLTELADIGAHAEPAVPFQLSTRSDVESVDPELSRHAQQIYARMRDVSPLA